MSDSSSEDAPECVEPALVSEPEWAAASEEADVRVFPACADLVLTGERAGMGLGGMTKM